MLTTLPDSSTATSPATFSSATVSLTVWSAMSKASTYPSWPKMHLPNPPKQPRLPLMRPPRTMTSPANPRIHQAGEVVVCASSSRLTGRWLGWNTSDRPTGIFMRLRRRTLEVSRVGVESDRGGNTGPRRGRMKFMADEGKRIERSELLDK